MFFGLDELHLIGLGLCKKLYGLLVGNYDVDGCETPISLTKKTWKNVEKDLELAKKNIQYQGLGYAFRLPETQQNHRAVDMIGLIIHIFPALVVPRLPFDTAYAVMNRVMFVQLSQKWQLDDLDLEFMDEQLMEFYNFINTVIINRQVNKRYLTPNLHYLKHITTAIRNLGSLRFYSTRPMERAIGGLKKDIRNNVKTGENAMNTMIDLLATAHLDRLYSLRRLLLNEDDDDLPPTTEDALGLDDMDKIYLVGKPSNISGKLPIQEDILRQLLAEVAGSSMDVMVYGRAKVNGEHFDSCLKSRGKRYICQFVLPGQTR
jgi:hypothetical protein